jgi:hypothetical protein
MLDIFIYYKSKKNLSEGIDRTDFFITFVKHLRPTTIQIQNLKKSERKIWNFEKFFLTL